MLYHLITMTTAGGINPEFQITETQFMEFAQLASMVGLGSNSDLTPKAVLIFDVPCFFLENNSI